MFSLNAGVVASAVELGDRVDLHGFGSQDYALTTSNSYLGADDRGTWDINFLGLVGDVALADRLQLWAQLEASNQDTTHFTWAFLNYDFSDALSLQVGRVKSPSGLYNEIVDTKFLQLSSISPGIYQDAADFVHDSYTGVGIRYEQNLLAGHVTYQLYVGQNYDPTSMPGVEDRALVGARITYATPLDGLHFMISYNRGDVEIEDPHKEVIEDRVIASVDYIAHEWDVKAEYANHRFKGVIADGYYIQAGHTLSSRWTPFLRFDALNLNRAQVGNVSFEQKTITAGLGIAVLSNISLRGEAEVNRGYALPVASGEVSANQGSRDWIMVVFGIHFVF